MFSRQDESDDRLFYAKPRFETHIDQPTIEAITDMYRQSLVADSMILDLMSSWISHLPSDMKFSRVVGLGMNEEELARNPQLDEYHVHDLNQAPELPYADDLFDAVLIAVSVQYLIKPVPVFASIGRVLKPAGQCIVSISHRLFPEKVVRAWLLLTHHQKCELVESYMNLSGCFDDVRTQDLSPKDADPLWVVRARCCL